MQVERLFIHCVVFTCIVSLGDGEMSALRMSCSSADILFNDRDI